MQAYQAEAPAGTQSNSDNRVANIIDKRPLSKDKTARPIQTPGSQKAADPTGLVHSTHNLPMALPANAQRIEAEDDKAQI